MASRSSRAPSRRCTARGPGGFRNSRNGSSQFRLCLGEPRRWRDAGVVATHHHKSASSAGVPSAPTAQVRSSGGIEKQWTGYNDQNDDIAAVYDGVDPLSSADESNLYFRMRPALGSPAWIEYQFSTPTPDLEGGGVLGGRPAMLQTPALLAHRLQEW